MLMLSFIALGVLMAAATLITLCAFLQAGDGYEDETGFHSGVPSLSSSPAPKRQPEWLRQLCAVVSRSTPVRLGSAWQRQPAVAGKEAGEDVPLEVSVS